jgi:hypothetical protein
MNASRGERLELFVIHCDRSCLALQIGSEGVPTNREQPLPAVGSVLKARPIAVRAKISFLYEVIGI